MLCMLIDTTMTVTFQGAVAPLHSVETSLGDPLAPIQTRLRRTRVPALVI